MENNGMKPEMIVHYSCARPVEPAVGTIYLDQITGYRERWDGTDWVPLKKDAKNGR